MQVRQGFRALAKNERGSTAIEYGLIATLIVIASIAALKNFASTNSRMWNNVATQVSGSAT